VNWAAEVVARREVWGRAPSAHNTQPWVVTAEGSGEDRRVAVGWDEARHLADGDPTRRDLLLGLGALVQSLVIVGAEQGSELEVQWRVDVARREAAVLRRVGPVVPAAAGPWGSAQLLARRTARSAYRQPWVTASQVVEVAGAADLPDGAGLTVVDPAWVERWLGVADRWSLEGPAAAELAQWLRLSPRHPRYRQDGLSDQALELGRVEAVGLRLSTTGPVRRLLSRTGAVALLARVATARPLGTVVALTAPQGLPPAAVGELGSGLLRVWLAAAERGWSAHPLSALLDCPESRAVWPSVGPGDDRAPYAVFRLGVAARPAPASARL
jgi:hypothetical protein